MRLMIAVILASLAALPTVAESQFRFEVPLGAPPLEAGRSSRISAASSGTEVLAVWNDDVSNQAFVTRIGVDGKVVPPIRRPLGAPLLPCGGSSIAWTGDSYIVLQRSGTVGCAGATTLIDREGTVVREPVTFGATAYAAVAANAERVLLLNEHLLSFMNRDGTGKFVARLPETLSCTNPVLVTRREGFTVFAMETVRGVGSRLHRIRIENSGNMTSTVVGDWAGSVNFGAAAADDDSELLVWSATTSAILPGSGKQGARVTTAALLLDSAGALKGGMVPISDTYYAAYGAYPVASPSVAWDGRRFAVAHIAGGSPRGATLMTTLIAADGTAVAGSNTVVERTTLVPDAAGLNSMFVSTDRSRMLLWSVKRNGDEGPDISLSSYRAFDGFDSIAAGRNEVIADTSAAQSQPSVSSDGNTIAVAWRESRYAWRIAGQVLTARGVALPPVVLSDSTIAAWDPVVASGGGVHMAVWRENEFAPRTGYPGNPITYRVVARRIGADGTLLDPSPIVVEEGTYASTDLLYEAPMFSPSVVWAGDAFAVAWTGKDGQLYMTRFSASGQRLERDARLTTGPMAKGRVRLMQVGEDLLAVYFARNAAYWTYIDIAGVPLSKDGVLGATVLFASGYATISDRVPFEAEWNGRELLVAWHQKASMNAPGYVVTRRFSTTATQIGAQLLEPVANEFVGDFVPDGNSWWHLTRADDGAPIAQKLDQNLSTTAAVQVSSSGDSRGDAVAVALNGNLLVVYARSEEGEPGSSAPRLFLQWIPTHGRERSVRR